jgi:hypothetical protein
MQQRKKRRGLLGTLLLAAILATAIFAYTNTIGMPASTPNVGAGDAAALGTYQITDITWNSAAGNTVDSVDLTFNAALVPTGTVRVSIDGKSTWVDCNAPVANVVSCDLGVTADTITGLSVYAQDS